MFTPTENSATCRDRGCRQLPSHEVVDGEPYSFIRVREKLSFCDRDDAIAAGFECTARTHRVGAARQPEMFLERITRDRTLDLATAYR